MKKFTLYTILGLVALFATGLSSCSVYDEDMDCDVIYKVRFIYDMNMSGGDGFPIQVKTVNLWVFDHATGNLVKEYTDSGDALDESSYRLVLNDLQPGDYDFIAWCGLGDDSQFSVPSIVHKKSDLKCSLATSSLNGQNVSNTLLSPLFYGALDAQQLGDQLGEYTYTVYLMKDTNNINISLQHLSDETLDASDFIIFMKDANGELNYDNSVLSSAAEITYFPWSTQSGDIDISDEDLNFMKAEISTCRLMADQNPVINIIAKETGNTVYSIPIVEWAKKLRSLQNLSMNDQEYLDREHEYTIMLHLLDEENGWKAASIVINGYQLD